MAFVAATGAGILAFGIEQVVMRRKEKEVTVTAGWDLPDPGDIEAIVGDRCDVSP